MIVRRRIPAIAVLILLLWAVLRQRIVVPDYVPVEVDGKGHAPVLLMRNALMALCRREERVVNTVIVVVVDAGGEEESVGN